MNNELIRLLITIGILIVVAVVAIMVAVFCAKMVNNSLIKYKDKRIYCFTVFNKIWSAMVPDGYHVNTQKDKVNYDDRYAEWDILPNKWGDPKNFDEITLGFSETDREYKDTTGSFNRFLRKYGLYFPGLWPFVKQRNITFTLLENVDLGYKPNLALKETTYYKDDKRHYVSKKVQQGYMFSEPRLELPVFGLDTIGSGTDKNAPMIAVNLMYRMTIVCYNIETIFFGTPDITMDAFQAVTAASRDIASSVTYRQLQMSKNEKGNDPDTEEDQNNAENKKNQHDKKTFVQHIKELINQDSPGGNSSSKKLYGIMLKHLNLVDIIPGDNKAKDYIESNTDITIAKNEAETFKAETEALVDRKKKLGDADNEILKNRVVHPDVKAKTDAIKELGKGNLRFLSLGGDDKDKVLPTITLDSVDDSKQTIKKDKNKKKDEQSK